MSKLTLEDVKRKYPNDYDLGSFIRRNYSEMDDLNDDEAGLVTKKYPNNFDLGGYMRHEYNSEFNG